VGDDFDSAKFRSFLHCLLLYEMKPFSVYFHKINKVIAEIEYPHLIIWDDEKRKLPLFPSIMIKCKDIGAEQKKDHFKILLGPLNLIKKE